MTSQTSAPPDNTSSVGSSAKVITRTGPVETVRKVLPKSYLLLVLVGIVVVGFVASPDFLTGRNAMNVVTFSAIVAVLAVGQFFVILTGGIDLSVGSIVAMSTVVTAILLQHGQPAGLSVVLTLIICGVVGLINGLLVVVLGLAPFIATLATLSMVQGLSYIIQSTTLIQITNQDFITWFSDGKILGIPNPVLIFVVIALVAAFVAKYSTFGRRLYAVGGNREAARLSGLPVSRDLLLTYTLSGLLAGLAGLLAAAQLLQGSSLIGQNYNLDAIAAVVVGGASLAGGRGDPISAVIGNLIIQTINNIMNLVGISSQPQLIIKGAVIIFAVFLSSAGGVTRLANLFAAFRGKRRPAVSDTS